MKKIIIVRHAETEGNSPTGQDIDRRLTPNGVKQARALGLKLREHGYHPDYALTSPATRAKETLENLLSGGGFKPRVTIKAEIYNAFEETLLSTLKNTPNDHDCALMVGHYPSIHELALRLSSHNLSEEMLFAREKIQFSYPVSTATCIQTDASFDRLNEASSELIEIFLT